ncbi:MAG: NCS2 family permease [Spirochaetales bacterium]|nr:NCS2 family permease [Spirochaetales bacterium]
MDNFFGITAKGSTFKREIIAGLTTFFAMVYILSVNPYFLSEAGMDAGAVFTASALSSAIATLFMALVARLPFALAPGMGLNAFFAFTVCGSMGYKWQFALAAVFVEGIIFILLSVIGVREAIVTSIPANIQKAISVGIGIFIAFIGLFGGNHGIIRLGTPETVPLHVSALNTFPVIITIICIILIGVLLYYDIKGSIFIGLIVGSILYYGIGTPFGLINNIDEIATSFKEWQIVPSLMPVWKGFAAFNWSELLTPNFLIVLFVFLFVDMFDTVGTIIGVASKANLIDEDGHIPGLKGALMADAVGTTVGACLGTSTVTTYVESASGVVAGGKSGFTAVIVSLMFFLSLFLSPIFLAIPAAATNAVLVIVGLFMISPVKQINISDPTEGLPVFLTILMMPLTYNIANGIIFGVTSYVILKLCTGQIKKVKISTTILAAVFVAYLILRAVDIVPAH